MSNSNHICVVSGKIIPPERVEALQMLGLPENRWTCVEHALAMPRKGIYMGETGTSELKIVNKVYNDSVRSVFGKAKKEASSESSSEDSIDDESEAKEDYAVKEISYYTSNEDLPDPEEKIEIIKRHSP